MARFEQGGIGLQDRIDRRAARRFAWLHVALAACVGLFFLYRGLVHLLPQRWTGCILHDWFFLYCPLCGGTRAVEAILQLRLDLAFRANAYVTVLTLIALGHYLAAWVRLLRGKARLFRFYPWEWIAMGVLLLVFGVLRNALMIRCGVDPLGDLVAFWNGMK